jgi:hypothetical protein
VALKDWQAKGHDAGTTASPWPEVGVVKGMSVAAAYVMCMIIRVCSWLILVVA